MRVNIPDVYLLARGNYIILPYDSYVSLFKCTCGCGFTWPRPHSPRTCLCGRIYWVEMAEETARALGYKGRQKNGNKCDHRRNFEAHAWTR